MLAMEMGPDGAVVVTGRLDAAQAASAQAFLDNIQGVATLDCRGLEYISSAGLGVIMEMYKRLRGRGHALRLANLSPHVRNVFRYSGLDRVIEIE